ncbi:MAG: endonuclease III [Deltaproteobacteria bacterium]
MKKSDIPVVISILKKEVKNLPLPYVTDVSIRTSDPFKVLISCILSLRTKDATTKAASERLFKKAGTPEELASFGVKEIEKAIYPAGFYKVKARTIKNISKKLIQLYRSKVPDSIEELLKFKGVGRKTANLVLTRGYNLPGICVDTHVHRITNRWGLIKTKSPDKTEFALRNILPKRYWIIINDLLVAYGQNICVPVSPWCSKCRIYGYCKKVGVLRMR